MPMFSWLKKAYEGGKRFLGKVKGGLEKGIQLFQKGKEAYGSIKQRAADLPFVGQAATNLIGEAERRVAQKYGEVTGGRSGMADLATAERVAKRAVQGINMAEGMARRAERMGAE